MIERGEHCERGEKMKENKTSISLVVINRTLVCWWESWMMISRMWGVVKVEVLRQKKTYSKEWNRQLIKAWLLNSLKRWAFRGGLFWSLTYTSSETANEIRRNFFPRFWTYSILLLEMSRFHSRSEYDHEMTEQKEKIQPSINFIDFVLSHL